MSAIESFKAITGDILYTGQIIRHETELLSGQTTMLLGKIDDTSQELPPALYLAMIGFLSELKALLERSETERGRIGDLLQYAAQAIEGNERYVVAREAILASGS